jgi:PadR family transcriptional regulator AphA
MDTPNESKSQERVLTATSYAVLSVLSLRPHSTYDITRQMRLSLHYMWPRAESNVYAEPRRLVEAGLAAAREEWSGKRRRTVYEITAAGRAALADWLGSPSSPPRYESEALVKVMFAENGSRDDLLASIRAIGGEAADTMQRILRIADRYAAGEGEYPWRFGLSAVALGLVMEQRAATLRWAAWAEAVVATWDTPVSGDVASGIETLRSTGEPLPIDEGPVRNIVQDPPVADPASPVDDRTSVVQSDLRA